MVRGRGGAGGSPGRGGAGGSPGGGAGGSPGGGAGGSPGRGSDPGFGPGGGGYADPGPACCSGGEVVAPITYPTPLLTISSLGTANTRDDNKSSLIGSPNSRNTFETAAKDSSANDYHLKSNRRFSASRKIKFFHGNDLLSKRQVKGRSLTRDEKAGGLPRSLYAKVDFFKQIGGRRRLLT